MKYGQLTKEQLEPLHKEFAHFLASQKIDVEEWKTIRKENPTLAEDELTVFSDIVWDDVLNKTRYLEHFSKQSINLFKCDDNKIYRIVVKINREINVLEEEGYKWLLSNTGDASVEYFTGSKSYNNGKINLEIFDLIEKGSIISKGKLFEYFVQLII